MDVMTEAQFIDREAEAELFRQLLRFEDGRRLLTITDRGGRGKSTLLKKLEYICDWDMDVPCARVELDRITGMSDFDVVDTMRRSFGEDLSLGRFDRLNTARLLKDRSCLEAGVVDMRGASVQAGGVVAASATVIHGDVRGSVIGVPGQWSDELEQAARQRCVDAFLEDLDDAALERPLVILVDTVDEKSPLTLRKWIMKSLVKRRFVNVDTHESKLVLVLAGRTVGPDLKRRIGAEAFERSVKSIESLSEWKLEHVRDFLTMHGYSQLTDEDVGAVHGFIATGSSLALALQMAEVYKAAREES